MAKKKPKPLTTNARIELLAHRVNALEMDAQGVAQAAQPPLVVADKRKINFAVTKTDAKSVRISVLDDQKHPIVVVPSGAKSGSSPPYDNGAFVDVIVELLGSAGNSAEVSTTNTDTPTMKPSIPNDFPGTWYPMQYTLQMKW